MPVDGAARYLEAPIREDLARKMVFLTGPRQVGKTTLARRLLGKHKGYLSWDITEDRESILKQRLPAAGLWVLDEIHKYRGWRNYVKGLYDGRRRGQRILVTGSARLDFYRYGGDSLQGRYHMWRLHCLSVAELGLRSQKELHELLTLGGFPEPFFSGSERQAQRWSRDYRARLVREEVASLERVQDLGALELLALRLPELVGSPLSLNALREDLQVSHKTVTSWVAILERLYAVYRLPPFGTPKLRAVKKAQKHYHYDWSVVERPGPRFENLVASHLLKWTHFEQDSAGRDLELRYFRDVDGREVDFVVTEKRRPILAVECKTSDEEPSKHLRYFRQRFPECAAWQLALDGKQDYVTADGLRVAPAMTLLKTLV
jgi:predicted AAA+ superfamily ATPase